MNPDSSGVLFKPSSLVELLRYRANLSPEKIAFTFLLDKETQTAEIKYGELEQQARHIAKQLQHLGITEGRALLLYPPGLEFIAAFYGCLYAGVVAVPVYPPRPNQSLSRLQAILADAQIAIALTTTTILSNLESQAAQFPLPALQWLATDNVNDVAPEMGWQEPLVNSDTLALLQYTSGSTGTPKGVMVSHGNLLHNQQIIQQAMQHNKKSIIVGWLPLFHDMGLIGNVLQPLYLGCPCILMSPVAFLQRPLRWLQAISDYKATTSGGPNFAYDLCVRKITPEQRSTLDLSSWDVAFNGAEPIRAETLERFSDAFASCGFRATAFYPCYGMAETTLLVSGGIKTVLPVLKTVEVEALAKKQIVPAPSQQKGRTLVGCGQTWLNQQIAIVAPDTLTHCPPDLVGEIWVSGKSVAQGYWNQPIETNSTFRAYIVDTEEGPFLRTGDLGFLQDGELFVTGRLKDLIIIRGRNHYPQDIELTVEQSHPALRASSQAAFTIDVNGEERLAIASEVEREHLRKLDVDAVVRNILQAIAEQHGLEVYAVLLLKTGSIPKTSSGKIRRRACRENFLAGSLDVVGNWSAEDPSTLDRTPNIAPISERLQTAQSIQAWIVAKMAERLRVNNIDVCQTFAYYGLSSLAAVSLSGELEDWLQRRLSPTLVYDYPTIEALAQHLAGSEQSSLIASNKSTIEPIAMIGLGCRFPGAKNPADFWELLQKGVDAVTQPKERLSAGTLDDVLGTAPVVGGFLEQVDGFDAEFFGIPHHEAERMDPQQRLLLEVSWEALEDAGIAPDKLSGSQTGVFIGISSNDYSRLQFNSIDAFTITGNAHSIAANRLSYLLNLQGPSLAVDTACSSSLVAVHMACQSLRSGESNLAIAGGVNLILSTELSVGFTRAGLMASDGRCKTFDAAADGFVRSEGCGVVILKPLSAAISDGDRVLAIIRGSAINQDGHSNGLTAPNGRSQQQVIRQALKNADVAPNQISYVEAHGTGTALGDPIEISSLKTVLMEERSPDQVCAVGSVKTNIGHLEAAAGIAGLIKVVLSLQHAEIPRHLHLKTLNPHISLADTPLFIPNEKQPWAVSTESRFAGVSSFGFGGTNAHVVVERRGEVANADGRGWTQMSEGKGVDGQEENVCLLPLSARSPEALCSLIQTYKDFLTSNNTVALRDICYTASRHRSHHNHRLSFIVHSRHELILRLEAFLKEQLPPSPLCLHSSASIRVHPRSPSSPLPLSNKLVFVFSGQGPQWWAMGRELLHKEPGFRASIEQCDRLLSEHVNWSLLDELNQSESQSRLNETEIAQPSLFALQVALANLWRDWGIEPDAVVGHSMGEVAAAHISGALSLSDAIKVIYHRSRLLQQVTGLGLMVAVDLSVTELADLDRLCIAAINSPTSTVLSGSEEIVVEVVQNLERKGVLCQFLRGNSAFHSPQVEPLQSELVQALKGLSPKTATIPLFSTVTGQKVNSRDLDATYWSQNLRQTVLFSAAVDELIASGHNKFVEISPHPVLCGAIAQCLHHRQQEGIALPSLRRQVDERQVLLESLGTLYSLGYSVNWSSLYPTKGQNVQLPTYPWQRQRYWLSPAMGDRAREPPSEISGVSSPTPVSHTQLDVEPSDRHDLESYFRQQLAKVLKFPVSGLDLQQPFHTLGIDSLMAIELKYRIENDLGVTIKMADFLQCSNIAELATKIEQLRVTEAVTNEELEEGEI